MPIMMHIVIFICYAILASAVGYILSIEFSNFSQMDALLTSGNLFLLGALIHENIIRRATQTKLTRHLLSLKKAYDHTRVELDKGRSDNQDLSQPPSAEPKEGNSTKTGDLKSSDPAPLEAVPKLTRHSNLFDVEKHQVSEKDDFSNLFTATPSEQADRPLSKRIPPPAPAIEPVLSKEEISQASSEVQILHSLVEQLYSDIETPDNKPLERPLKAEDRTPS